MDSTTADDGTVTAVDQCEEVVAVHEVGGINR